MGFTQSYPPYPDRKEAIATLREAVELGVTFFDTAEVYSAFKNEELVGEALENRYATRLSSLRNSAIT